MKKILFIDDNPDLLRSLRRMLRVMRSEWEMEFVESGREALEVLEKESYDVVVSDIRMPEMDGVQLLTEIKKLYPRTVRIALSGQSDQEVVLRSVGPTHQFLAKPCDADTLKAVVKRSCALQDLLSDTTLIQLVSRLESLPSLPSLYLEIIEELKSPRSSMSRIGNIISKDIGMTAKILQLVNSAFFGIPQHVSNPAQAATLLGIDIIKALVLSVHIFQHSDLPTIEHLDYELLWRHSAVTSILAKRIAIEEKFDSKTIDDIFMAGLLHDVGILILASGLPAAYDEVMRLTVREDIPIVKAEQQVLGKTHAEVGGYLMGLWGLSDSIVEAIYFHHLPSEFPEINLSPLTVVHVANELESHKPKDIKTELNIDMEYMEKLGIADRIPAWRAIRDEINQKGEIDEQEDSPGR